MNQNILLHLACPVCRSVLRLWDARRRRGVISSGELRCPTCGYHGTIQARIPILLPPGGEAVYRNPFQRVAGVNWQQWAQKKGWDALAGKLMTSDTEPKFRQRTLPPRVFRKSIYEGSDYYYETVLKSRDDDRPSPGKELDFLVKQMITHRPRLLLDIGAGEGMLVQRLLPYRPGTGAIICADIDYGSLKVLEGYVRRAPVKSTVQSVACDLRRLPFPSSHFDAAVSLNGMAHVEGVDELLSEVHRLLKPGARLWLTEPAYGTNLHQGKSLETLILHGLRNTLRLHHGESDLVRRLNQVGFIIESVSRHVTYQRQYTLISAVTDGG